MQRCEYPRCDRIVRDPNKYNLCHVHLDMAEFYIWFAEYLNRVERIAGKGASVRSSGLIVPPGSTA
ncbi:MAG: hypothetical protein V3V35_11215 [Dehalococcoidia bacterium]